MESLLKKVEQKLRKTKQEMEHWEDLQSRFISQFTNASSIIQRLEVIGDKNNYGVLQGIDGIVTVVLQKQMESLQSILRSIDSTMEGFHGIVLSMEKMIRDTRQLVESHKLSVKQLQQRIGIKPSLSDCLDALTTLHEMHNNEYKLKTSVVSTLSKIAYKKPSASDLTAMRQLLVDQPNLPKYKVESIFEVIFAGDTC